MNKQKVGILLLNLGTPSAPDVLSVTRYLREFLDDPRVIDLPSFVRKIVLYGLILPFRPRKSAKAYQAIWDPQTGSPLLFHTQNLARELQKLTPSYQVAFGMRYGKPSIESAVDKLLNEACDKIVVVPLFPQYSSAATGSALQKVFEVIAKRGNIPTVSFLSSFYQDPGYIEAQAEVIAPYLKNSKVDKLIFSYHSLPQRQIEKTKSACRLSCQQNAPCAQINHQTQWCYRAQCFQTSRLLAERLGLSVQDYDVAFQSRLGRTTWVGPDIETLLKQYRHEKLQNLLIICPSFVADCLETLEEIGMRAKETWRNLGGGEFTLVPCLNDHPKWIEALAALIQTHKPV